MFWMCSDETVINLNYVKYFYKQDTEDVPDSKSRIVFVYKNGNPLTDTYGSKEERDYAYDTLLNELGVII